VGIGYAAAVFVQLLSIGTLLLCKAGFSTSSETLPLRIVLLLVGSCWFAFTVPSCLWLRSRPGPALEPFAAGKSGWRHFVAHVIFAWSSVWKTIKIAAKLRQVVTFLVAWFLLSDAIATMSGTAIMFARTELKMATTAIAVLSITVTTSGIAGAFLWPAISRRFGLQTNQTILVCVGLFEIIPLYGLLYYLPFVRHWGVGGLQKPWELYILGVVFGFVMGGLSSYCRSFLAFLYHQGVRLRSMHYLQSPTKEALSLDQLLLVG